MVNQVIKRRAIHRAKILQGQLKGLERAIDREEYCIQLILQSRSIQKSLRSLDKLLLQNHLITHVAHQLSKKGKEQKRAVVELLNVYTYT